MVSDKLFQGGVQIAKLILKNECVGKQNKMCTYSILYRWKWHSMCHVFTTVESETYKLTSPQFMKSHVRVKSKLDMDASPEICNMQRLLLFLLLPS